jgi:DNA (cytosine-5)-methyltransferase 1
VDLAGDVRGQRVRQQQIPGIGGVLPGELIVDLFAGGGGASSGIEKALGRSPDIAINHDPHAIQMHERNHPATTHYCQDVFHREVHPRDLARGQRVGLLWFSPDCRHFSRAKGSAPVSATVRGLCWVGLRWAKHARPRVAVMENVPEFQTFGPLLPDGRPNPARAGEYYRAFLRQWRHHGYVVESRVIVCADLGAPTTRKRLFIVARRDGEPIVWPVATHGRHGAPRPWRAAAECIDWSIPCPSIFERKRPLAPATCRRIARGIVRYVLNGEPFLVQVAHGDHVARPGDRCTSLGAPIGAVTKTNNHALVTPTLVQTGYGEREGQAPRCLDINAPLGTAPAGGQKHALVAAFLAKHNGGTTGQAMTEPVHTIAGNINKAVVAAHLSVFRQNSSGQALGEPMRTLTSGGGRGAASMAVVAAFLIQYYSTGTQDQVLDEPLATIVTRARHGLVTVTIDGVDYAIVDIGMRMLEPAELARAQGFDPEYVLTGNKSQQIARIGNSVCPPVAQAVVGANFRRAA